MKTETKQTTTTKIYKKNTEKISEIKKEVFEKIGLKLTNEDLIDLIIDDDTEKLTKIVLKKLKDRFK